MYGIMYGLFVKDGYVTPKLEPKFYNNTGEVCEEEEVEQFGEYVNLALKHPELVFVADECGTNTNISKDKLLSDNKRCSTKGGAVTTPACTSDMYFTTTVMTVLIGEIIYTVVIFEKGDPLTNEGINGFDAEKQWIGDDSILQYVRDYEKTIKKQYLY